MQAARCNERESSTPSPGPSTMNIGRDVQTSSATESYPTSTIWRDGNGRCRFPHFLAYPLSKAMWATQNLRFAAQLSRLPALPRRPLATAPRPGRVMGFEPKFDISTGDPRFLAQPWRRRGTSRATGGAWMAGKQILGEDSVRD